LFDLLTVNNTFASDPIETSTVFQTMAWKLKMCYRIHIFHKCLNAL